MDVNENTEHTATELLPVVTSLPRTPYSLRSQVRMPVTAPSAEDGEQKGENAPIFYTGIGPDKLQEQISMVHSKKDIQKSNTRWSSDVRFKFGNNFVLIINNNNK